jgi:hypothetical protein
MRDFKKRFVIIKAIIVLIAPIIFGFFPTERAFACSCIVPGTPEEEFKKFDAVFIGTVTSISERPAPDHLSEIDKALYPKVKIGIHVGQSWKGVTTDFIYVYTGFGGGDCGYSVAGFETYLVYASGPIDDLNISICSRTAWYNEAQEDRNYLKQLQELPLTHFEPENNSIDNKKDGAIILLAGSTIVFFAVASYLIVKNQQIKRKID